MSCISAFDPRILSYYKILEPDGIPAWLEEYIETPPMLHQQHISMSCGTLYTDLFNSHFFYSSLAHSIGVALIIWHFTRDKKQTLAGLFHDIATPAFKHCVDFLEQDYGTQENTEELTTEIINNSEQLMALLARDNIDVCEIDDYHIYPIADNDTPRLAADRLEYTFSNLAFTYQYSSLDEIAHFYNDLEIQTNENGSPELGFKHKTIARNFIRLTSKLSIIYRFEPTIFSMEFIAEILRRLIKSGLIKKSDLWRLSETEIIKIIENSEFKDVFIIWQKSRKVHTSMVAPKNKYYVHGINAKVRYIDPLINGSRASITDPASATFITKNLSHKNADYIYLDFML